jgi:hypothetical protein
MEREHPIHLLWGTYTWILFHWIAEHIKENFFDTERENILQLIYLICNNLPCPNCREHARNYIKSIPFRYIKTKTDLKNYIYHFHNVVNTRSKKTYQPYSILDKYKTLNVKLLFDSWNHHFSYSNDIQRHDFMAKKQLADIKKKVNEYFSVNSYKFEMS